MRLLIVDDDAASLRAIESALSPLGHPIAVARSLAEAKSILAMRDVALVVLGIDGARIDELRPRPSDTTPVLVLTTSDSPSAVIAAFEQGAVDALAKPPTADILRTKARLFIELYEKRAITERRDTEERYRGLFDVIDEGLCVIEMMFDDAGKPVDYRYVQTNASFDRQMRRGNITGMTVRELVPDIEQRWLEMYGKVAMTGEAARVVDEAKHMERWYDVYACRIGAPELRRVAVLFDDITERIRAESSNAKFRTFFEQGSNFALVLGHDGAVVEANRLCLEACGFARDDVIGRPFWECGWWNRSSAQMQLVHDAFDQAAAGQMFSADTTYFISDASERYVNLILAPVRADDGSILFVAATGTDITDQKQISNELQDANRRKDEFLATASHELRTPLNAILGWARLLRGGQLDVAAVSRAVETIERNANVQVRLVEDILDGSRIITGKLHLEIRPLDLAALIRAALDAIRPAADAKNIELSIDLDPTAARIMGDSDRLQQVLWNLATNAIKFTPRGGRVDVRLQRVNSAIELSVKDTGQGIGADFLPHVFEHFRQADGSTTRRFGGLGLGLALVRHLVEAHGGTVRAASDGDGHGATFTISLPVQAIASELPAAERVSAAPAAVSARSRPSLAGVTALVVDDEADARELIATVLRASGARVTTASNATQAMTAITADAPPMVMISDIGMPIVDGYELIRRIRALPNAGASSIPAVALTAYAREEDRRLAVSAGFHAHVSKPVEPAELIRVVASLVTRRDDSA